MSLREEIISALEPFSDACAHLNPAHPLDGETLDGFKVADFYRAGHMFNRLHSLPTDEECGRLVEEARDNASCIRRALPLQTLDEVEKLEADAFLFERLATALSSRLAVPSAVGVDREAVARIIAKLAEHYIEIGTHALGPMHVSSDAETIQAATTAVLAAIKLEYRAMSAAGITRKDALRPEEDDETSDEYMPPDMMARADARTMAAIDRARKDALAQQPEGEE